MSLEKLTSKEKIEKREYPSYDTYIMLNELTKSFIKESGDLSKLNDKEKETLFLKPDGLSEAGYDYYTYFAAVNLGTALLSLKTLYYSNGINIEGKTLLSDEEIISTMPKAVYEAISRHLAHDLSLENEVSIAAESLINGIETELSKMPDYKKKYSSKELMQTIQQDLKNVGRYANLCFGLGDVLISVKELAKGHTLKGAMTHLRDAEDLFDMIKNDKYDDILYEILEAHALLRDFIPSKDVASFRHKCGEQISFAMDLAQKISEWKHMINEAKVSGGEPFMGLTKEGKIYAQKDPKCIIEKERGYGLATLISKLIYEESTVQNMILKYKLKSPFDNLHEQLNALGIEWKLAKDIVEYLSITVLNRKLTGIDIKPPQHYKILTGSNKKYEYASAMKLLIENVIGKKIHDFSFQYFSGYETDLSNAISNLITVTRVKGNGKIKKIYEDSSHKDLNTILEDVTKQFTNPEYEICVKDNIGVCFLYDWDLGFTPKVDFRSIIEVQDDYKHIEEVDELASKLYAMEVMAHETTHVSQINSRLAWRKFAAELVKMVVDTAIEKNKEGKLDYQGYFPKSNTPVTLNKKLEKKNTLRNELLNLLKIHEVQALGIGKFAEKCREKGVYDAMCRIEGFIPITIHGELNMKLFSETELENSKVSGLVKKTEDAIKNNDIKKLYYLREKAEDYSEELLTISETMAESFGYICTKDFIENHYSKRFSKKRRKYYSDSLKSGLIRKGVNGEFVADTICKFKRNPGIMEVELNKRGFTYKRVLSKDYDQRPVEKRLIALGYNPFDLMEAYRDMVELEKRALSKGWKLKDVLYPMNNAQAIISARYCKNLPTFFEIIEKYGSQKAHDLMLNAQSLRELKSLIK